MIQKYIQMKNKTVCNCIRLKGFLDLPSSAMLKNQHIWGKGSLKRLFTNQVLFLFMKKMFFLVNIIFLSILGKSYLRKDTFGMYISNIYTYINTNLSCISYSYTHNNFINVIFSIILRDSLKIISI